MKMFAVMRHGKVSLESGKWSKVGLSDAHNRRLESKTVIKNYGQEVADKVKANDKRCQVDQSRTHYNRSLVDYEPGQQVDLKSVIKDRIDNAKASIKRKDACVAEEVMVTTSPEYWGDWKTQIDSKEFQDKLDAWQDATMKWFKKKYGDNVVQAELHLDETTPHIHLMIVPIMEKNGQNVLCAKDMFAPKELNKNQTEYAKAMEGFGLVRGQERSESKHISFHEHARMKAKDAEHKKALQQKDKEHNDLVGKAHSNGKTSMFPQLAKLSEMVDDRNEKLEQANATIVLMSKKLQQQDQALAEQKRLTLAALDAVQELEKMAAQTRGSAMETHREYADWVEERYGKVCQHAETYAQAVRQNPLRYGSLTFSDFMADDQKRSQDRMYAVNVPIQVDVLGQGRTTNYYDALTNAQEQIRHKSNELELDR